MKREGTPLPFIPFKLVIETKEEREVLRVLELEASAEITNKIAKTTGLTYDEADDVLEDFGKLLRQE